MGDQKDQQEKRKAQLREAQRRFRAKQKEQEEREKRDAANQERAGSAYTSPDPEQMQNGSNLSGLPWGGLSLSYMMQSGQHDKTSDATSYDTSDVKGDK